jgi:hypothetical protein
MAGALSSLSLSRCAAAAAAAVWWKLIGGGDGREEDGYYIPANKTLAGWAYGLCGWAR